MWGVRGSGRRGGEGIGQDSQTGGHGYGVSGGGGDFAEDEIRAAEMLGISVREVKAFGDSHVAKKLGWVITFGLESVCYRNEILS